MHEKYGEDGLSVIGVTNETGVKVKNYVEVNNVKYSIVATPDNMKAFSTVKTVPHAFLIDISGKILWRGNPAGFDESMLERELSKVPPPLLAKLPKDVSSKR